MSESALAAATLTGEDIVKEHFYVGKLLNCPAVPFGYAGLKNPEGWTLRVREHGGYMNAVYETTFSYTLTLQATHGGFGVSSTYANPAPRYGSRDSAGQNVALAFSHVPEDILKAISLIVNIDLLSL